MAFVAPNLTPALPEIFVLAMAAIVLMADLFSGKNRFVAYALTQVTLLGAAWITVGTSGGEIVHTFGGMFVGDVMSDVLKLMT